MTTTVPAAGELSERSVLDALLHPRSVAVIGASRNPGALGSRPLGFMARYSRVFRDHGVIETRDGEELIDVVQAVAKTRRLAARPRPASGARIGIVTTSGGAGVWLADACSARGMAVPELSRPVQDLLKPLMPRFGSPVNPVDLTAQFTAGGAFTPALRVLLESGEVDALALVTSLASAGRLEPDADALTELTGRFGIPVLVYSYTRPAPSCARILQHLGLPWYTTAARTARGLAALAGAAV